MKVSKEILKTKVKAQALVFMIIAIVFVILAIAVGIKEYHKYTELAKVDAKLNLDANEIQNQIQTEPLVEENTEVTNEMIENIKKESKVDEKEAQEKNEKEYEKLKKEKKVSIDTPPYFIKVNYGAQVVTIYKKDSNGNYTKPIKAMVCSTGTYTPTSGTYRTLAKGDWWGLYGDVYGQYATHIVGGILFHSVPYKIKGDRSSLKYNAYDQLGSRVSMGCVRLTVADAKWIYDNCRIGTQVQFYASSNPGPLGKPSAKKISSAPNSVRGWDPTDPNSNNPWPKYLKSLNEKKDKDKNNNKDKDKNQNQNQKPNKDKNPEKDKENNNQGNGDNKPSSGDKDKPNSGNDDKKPNTGDGDVKDPNKEEDKKPEEPQKPQNPTESDEKEEGGKKELEESKI